MATEKVITKETISTPTLQNCHLGYFIHIFMAFHREFLYFNFATSVWIINSICWKIIRKGEPYLYCPQQDTENFLMRLSTPCNVQYTLLEWELHVIVLENTVLCLEGCTILRYNNMNAGFNVPNNMALILRFHCTR